MSEFEVRARLRVREGQLDGFKRQAAEMIRLAREQDTGTLAYDWFLSRDGAECEVREAYVDPDALVDHAMHVLPARMALFAGYAYDHRLAMYAQPSPRLTELLGRAGVEVTWFAPLKALES